MAGEKWWDDDERSLGGPAETPVSDMPATSEIPVATPRPDGSDGGGKRTGWILGASLLVVAVVIGVIIGLLVAGGDGSADGGPADDPVDTEDVRADVDRSERLQALLERTDWDDPDEGEIPVVDNDETRSWLEGEGSGVVAMVDGSEDLWSTGVAGCEATADVLDAIGTPEELLAAAAGTPDGPTSDILVNLYSSTIQTLAACAEPDDFEEAVAPFAWHWAVADRRLEDLGVNR